MFGWLSNGRPAGLQLLPRRSARGYVLGSVTCNNVRWYNGLFIGLAPLALLPFALLLFRWPFTKSPSIPPVSSSGVARARKAWAR